MRGAGSARARRQASDPTQPGTPVRRLGRIPSMGLPENRHQHAWDHQEAPRAHDGPGCPLPTAGNQEAGIIASPPHHDRDRPWPWATSVFQH